MAEGTLQVLLISAQGIANKDWFGKQDPYGIVMFGQQKFKSNVALDHGTKPIWNQTFTFHVDNDCSQEELIIELYDADRFTADDLIGTARIPIANVIAGAPSTATSYNVYLPNGKSKGEVKVSLAFTPKRDMNHRAHQ